METEAHVFAFSIAVSVLLSFYPFLLVMLSLCHDVLKWKAAEEAVYFALRDFFPEKLGDFIANNLRVSVASRGPFRPVSVLLLLFTANGIFEPLEVALNRAWNTANRSYFRNQLLSLGMIFACGTLAMISATFTALNRDFLTNMGYEGTIFSVLSVAFFKMAAVPVAMAILFLIYWLLPNVRVSAAKIVPAAIFVGLILEVLKYINVLSWPWLRLKLNREYGPFYYSVSIVLWSFLAAMIVLAGAEWSARSARVCKAGPASIDSRS
ncbi:MAG: YihY/virulence factor BrkB family protein [Acidobacteria bacterium]|nr:YihY/virulence factor BrkB family protein [Acidobacteriota bacterium]